MKRTVPLLIMFISGMVLIVSTFVPPAEELKEDIAVWFDILAAVAFVLGGGNLLMMHLSKIASKRAGWGYSFVTLAAFLITLIVGMIKLGAPPAENTEAFGTVKVALELKDFPVETHVDGKIPEDTRGPISRLLKPHYLPPTVGGQLAAVSQNEGPAVSFTGWMRPSQLDALTNFRLNQNWHDIVQKIYQQSQPPEQCQSLIEYNAQLASLSFKGMMTDQQRDSLLKLSQLPNWQKAINQLHTLSNRNHQVTLADLSAEQTDAISQITIPEKIASTVHFQAGKSLSVVGPMLPEVRQSLKKLSQLKPGKALTQTEKNELKKELARRGPFNSAQSERLQNFTASAETVGLRNKDLLFSLLLFNQQQQKMNPSESSSGLTEEQTQYLMSTYNNQELPWQQKVDEIFYLSQQPKYVWSGNYDPEGSAFWYIFEYALMPLTSTMFALLAFYVASAAFRAFRAKNVEASLLLGTAFLILLGNTYAGTFLTSWIPAAGDEAGWLAELIAGLKLSNLSAVIMRVFNTAGTRAIMIGIALGIASTSLKVLLGIDRSYLGSD